MKCFFSFHFISTCSWLYVFSLGGVCTKLYRAPTGGAWEPVCRKDQSKSGWVGSLASAMVTSQGTGLGMDGLKAWECTWSGRYAFCRALNIVTVVHKSMA
ncbi:hypothetical protein F4776DRAFT_308610 [Hypoxylon sp. NC0597]|nr:hypothetical protein F4776DRAFT_308610 [Hypoxylon sp. NC0597]